MFEKVVKVCSSCSCEFEGLNIARWTLCGTCSAKERADELGRFKDEARARMPRLVDDRLAQLGMSSEERASDPQRIPAALADAIPDQTVSELMLGLPVLRGFGLSGTVGAGKSMALAAIMRKALERSMDRALDALTEVPGPHDAERWRAVGAFRWVSWPGMAAWMKNASRTRQGAAEVEDRVEQLSTTRLLVLDDLGRELMRDDYTRDTAVGQLDRIVDARSRERRPILWTANQDRAELASMYGAAMVDRLCHLAPMVRLPEMPSLRGA